MTLTVDWIHKHYLFLINSMATTQIDLLALVYSILGLKTHGIHCVPQHNLKQIFPCVFSQRLQSSRTRIIAHEACLPHLSTYSMGSQLALTQLTIHTRWVDLTTRAHCNQFQEASMYLPISTQVHNFDANTYVWTCPWYEALQQLASGLGWPQKRICSRWDW